MSPDDFTDDTFYSPVKVAPLFGVSSRLVSSWCRKGILPALRLPGSGTHYRILGADVKKLYRDSWTVRPVVRSATALAKVVSRDQRAIKDIERMIRQPMPA